MPTNAPTVTPPEPFTPESDAWTAGWNGQGWENYSGSGPVPTYASYAGHFTSDPVLQHWYELGNAQGNASDAFVNSIFYGSK